MTCQFRPSSKDRFPTYVVSSTNLALRVRQVRVLDLAQRIDDAEGESLDGASILIGSLDFLKYERPPLLRRRLGELPCSCGGYIGWCGWSLRARLNTGRSR